MSLTTGSCAASLSTLDRQIGHVLCSRNHRSMHSSWNTWEQVSIFTTMSPCFNWLKHTTQLFPSTLWLFRYMYVRRKWSMLELWWRFPWGGSRCSGLIMLDSGSVFLDWCLWLCWYLLLATEMRKIISGEAPINRITVAGRADLLKSSRYTTNMQMSHMMHAAHQNFWAFVEQ
jgi:hypothetical protein